VIHHPIIQSSRKHRAQARALWSYTYEGRTLPDILIDGNVDLVLTGHTHTYERFVLERADGRSLHLINISGRPRTDFLWFGASARRARDISGREIAWLADCGWTDLEDWSVTQEDAMVGGEANQFAIFNVSADGTLTMEMHFLDDDNPGGLRRCTPVRLR
jgi:hypothetical protein